MSNPNPVTTPPQSTSETQPPGWTPTGSTIGSAVGGALAVILIDIYGHLLKEPVDALTSAAFTTLCSTLLGYFMNGGRK